MEVISTQRAPNSLIATPLVTQKFPRSLPITVNSAEWENLQGLVAMRIVHDWYEDSDTWESNYFGSLANIICTANHMHCTVLMVFRCESATMFYNRICIFDMTGVVCLAIYQVDLEFASVPAASWPSAVGYIRSVFNQLFTNLIDAIRFTFSIVSYYSRGREPFSRKEQYIGLTFSIVITKEPYNDVNQLLRHNWRFMTQWEHEIEVDYTVFVMWCYMLYHPH